MANDNEDDTFEKSAVAKAAVERVVVLVNMH